MADDKQIDIMEGNVQIGNGKNKQYINPTTNNNPTINNNTTTNNNPTINNNGVNVTFNCTINLGNNPQPVAQHSTTSHHLTREQLLQLQQLSQSGLLPEHAVQQVTDVVVRQHSTEMTSQSCDECIIRKRPRCSTCGERTTPGQSVPPPSQSAEESTQPPESPQSRRPLSDHQQSRNRRRAADRTQISSGRNKLTDVQPSKQRPGCSESDQTCRVPAEQTVPSTQPAPTETPEDIQIYDSAGRVLQPGDGVTVGSGLFPLYHGIYIGNMQVVRCEEETQKVIIEKLDVSEQFRRRTPFSKGRCKIFPAKMRADRARSCIGEVSPVKETWRGVDFMYWTFTGLNCEQAWNEGFGPSSLRNRDPCLLM